MANGDVQNSVSDQYLQSFDRSIGVSGVQKLQSFPTLQKLGYAGQLGSMKSDFHGLQDFKSQMTKYSSVSKTMRLAWRLIQSIVPNNISIQRMLIDVPGLGTVGNSFRSIHNFGQVFSLAPGDLSSPAAVHAKASVYKNQSTQADVVTNQTNALVGGGAGITGPTNANQLNGVQIIGTPSLTNNTLVFNGTELVWAAGGGGGGGGSSTFAGLTDVSLSSPVSGQIVVYNSGLGKWVNHTLVASDIPNINESQVINLVSDLAAKASLASPTFTGTPSAPTAAPGTNTTQLATTAFVAAAVSGATGPSSYTSPSHQWIKTYNSGTGTFTSTQPTASDVSGLATVATTGAYSDLSGRPSLATVATTGAYSDLTGTPTLAQTLAAVSHKFFTSYDASTGLFTAAQPAYSDISGTPTLAQTLAAVSHKFFTSYDASTGLFTSAQPAATDISGLATVATTGAYSDLTGKPQLAQTKTATSHQFFTAYDASTGLFTAAQPAAADLSDGTTGTGSVVLSASPTFTGTPAAPTAAPGTNTTQIATTAFVTAAVGGGGGSSTLAGDTDVSISSPSNNQVLTYNSGTGKWVNQTPSNTSTVPSITTEAPSGTLNGSNTVFTLSYVPNPTNSLELFLNGILQKYGTDYTLSGNTITMTTAPASTDTLCAYYWTSGAGNQTNVYVVAGAPDAPPASPTMYDDEFNGNSLSGLWTVTKANIAAVTPVVRNGRLCIDSPTGVHDYNIAFAHSVAHASGNEYTLKASTLGGSMSMVMCDPANSKIVFFQVAPASGDVEPLTVLVMHTTGTLSAIGSISWVSTPFNTTGGGYQWMEDFYMRIKDDGANFIFSISFDGIVWKQLYSEGRTAYLTAPTQVGLVLGDKDGQSSSVDWFRETHGGYTPTIPSPYTGALAISSLTAKPGSVNLTTEGAIDYLSLGGTASVPHTASNANIHAKINGGWLEQSFDFIYNSTASPSVGGATGINWSSTAGDDVGTPLSSVNVNSTYIGGTGSAQLNCGWRFRVPASPTATRTLKLYLGAYATAVTVTAHLTDGSAADVTKVVDAGSSSGFTDGYLTITFNSATFGAELCVNAQVTTNYGTGFQGCYFYGATLN